MIDFDTAKNALEKLEGEVGVLGNVAESYRKRISDECEELKNAVDKLSKTAVLSADEWAKADQPKVIKKITLELPVRLKIIKDSLEQAGDELAIGTKQAKSVIIPGAILLFVMFGIYIWLHKQVNYPAYNKESGKVFFELVGKTKASILNPDLKQLDEIHLSSPNGSSSGQESGTETGKQVGVRYDAFVMEFTERISALNGYIKIFNESGTATAQEIAKKISEEIGKIERDAIGFSKNDGFFWVAGYWRWLEIVLWGEFGVVVGVLVWVCTQIEKGVYTKGLYERERYWYLTEVVIGPAVIVAVFFLLRQFIGTFMTGIAEEEVRGSIYLTLGISFTLGFFIRRTLGIFDYIKEKLPLPKV